MNAKRTLCIAAGILAALTSTAWGGNGNDGQSFIVPPQANYGGKSHAEWVQAYWQWAVSIPGTAGDFPWLNDGPSFELNQQGPVFFLGATGSWSDQIPQGTPLANALASYEPEQRSVTVPAGKALYVEVDGNVYFVHGLQGQTVDYWDAANVAFVESFEPFNFILQIDDQNVTIDTGSDSPFFVSTALTSVPVAPGSAFPYFEFGSVAAFETWAGGDTIPYLFVADMSFLIKPLPPGEHTVSVRTFDAWYGYAYSELSAVDWHITVTP
jgi:hypothetical protein